MRRVFMDSSAFVALVNTEDPSHTDARSIGREVFSRSVRPFTSNFVVAETYTALLVRVGRDAAISWGRSFRDSSVIDLVRLDEALEEEAWQILEAHADKRWSYVDATSFALMARERVDEAFSFDRDFEQRGLRLLRPRK